MCTVRIVTEEILGGGYLTCELEETEGHTHSDVCYEEVSAEQDDAKATPSEATRVERVLTCGKEEKTAHTHGENCYEGTETLTCEREEAEGHIHSENCYESKDILTCKEKEVVPHTHEVSCYDEAGALSCGLLEVESHQHTEACVSQPDTEPQEVKKLICDHVVHKHTETCFMAEETEYICGMEEHEHWEACMDNQGNLICGKEEHVHTEDCLAPEISLLAELPGKYIGGGTIEGTDVEWIVTESDAGVRTLTIRGEGAIPDYTNVNLTPWYSYIIDGKMENLVVEDGITRVGNQAFAGSKFTNCELGDTIESLGNSAFSGAAGITEIRMPSSLKTIGDACFYNINALKTVELNEGLETIGVHAFFCNTTGKDGVERIYLPSTLKSIGAENFSACEWFEVSEENENFSAVDGVLFNKDQTTLMIYPKYREAAEYIVPTSVKTIAGNAFTRVKTVDRLVINHPVTLDGNDTFSYSNYREIELSSGVKIGGVAFRNCTMLERLTLPEDLITISNPITGCTSLKEIRIPSGVTYMAQLVLPNTELRLVYDAENLNSWSTNQNSFSSQATVDFVIGSNVKQIDWTGQEGKTKFAEIFGESRSFSFEGPNSLHVTEGSFAYAPAPLKDISGDLYVDEQGVVYAYDTETGTASMVYCPPGLTELQVPATISVGDTSYPITSVGQNALKLAEGLESIGFAAPESITKLEAYAFANCPTLKRINGKTDYNEICETKENAGQDKVFSKLSQENIGYNAFLNTGIENVPGRVVPEGTDTNGYASLHIEREEADSLEVSVTGKDDVKITWQGNGDGTEEQPETGAYHVLTGTTVQVKLNTETNDGVTKAFVYRMYIEKGSDEMPIDRNEVQPTEDPNTFYVDYLIEPGMTSSKFFELGYPSPDSAGGDVNVWGVILSEEEAEEYANTRLESTSGQIQMHWETKPEVFKVEKTSTGTNRLQVVGDGKGGAKPNDNLGWQIKLSHEQTTNPELGKDFATSVTYRDRLTLPEGVAWNSEVIAAIEAGTLRRVGNDIYAGDTRLVTISTGGGEISWDAENETAVITWNKRNGSQETELGADTVNLIVYADALSVDMKEYEKFKDGAEIKNIVTAEVQFHYSKPQVIQAEATKQIGGGAGTVALTKTNTSVNYFGEDITYTLNLKNPGALPWTSEESGRYVVQDRLENTLYITPLHMQEMFENPDTGAALEITITGAQLGSWKPVQGAIQGSVQEETSYQHPGNSNMETSTHTLVISKTDDGYQVQVDGSPAATGDRIEELLQRLGYAPTSTAQYTCEWTVYDGDGQYTIAGGAEEQYQILATVKDTFQLTAKDWPHKYLGAGETDPLNISNGADLVAPSGKYEANSNNVDVDVRREAEIAKGVSKDGQYMAEPTAKDGDILDYRLDFTHYGKGTYDDLPMVDDLYGSQLLLVPVSLNSRLAQKGLAITKDKEGNEYYILTEGSYENVVVGVDDEENNLTAASITVRKADQETEVEAGSDRFNYTGLHTQIKWYFSHLNGGDYKKTVSYKALVDMSLSGTSYTIGNIVWMNDKKDDRIYASLWGGGTTIDFNKKIVTEKGNTPAQDKIAPDDYSLVGRGDKVLYRLSIQNFGEGRVELSGKDLADALPQTYGTDGSGRFRWTKENVKIVDSTWTGDKQPVFTNMEDWYIGNSYAGLIGDRQYMLWPETSKITFEGSGVMILYVELTFPNDDENGDVWSQYAADNGGRMLNNTMYVYGFQSNVLHELKESGRVLLQKGVYSFERRDSEDSVNYTQTGSSRLYYNNRDSKYRSITYYVTLYNGGSKRLYLSDMYDTLPKGFTYRGMVSLGNQRDTYNTIITKSGTKSIETGHNGQWLAVTSDHSGQVGEAITYRSATVTATVDQEGQQVQYSFSNGDDGSYPLKFDTQRGQYYLDQGEAIVFGYRADIGVTADTEARAENTIAMPYIDHLKTGVNQITKSNVGVNAKAIDQYADYNDGNRLTMSAQEVEKRYGFEGNGEDTWLVSNVTVRRGEIIPGVTKMAETYTDASGPHIYQNSITPGDTVHWKVRLDNSGTMSMTDYSFTDIMPRPFQFVGSVNYTIYDAANIKLAENPILEFKERTGNLSAVTYINRYAGSSEELEAGFDGSSHVLRENELSFSLEKDSSENEVLKIHFQAAAFSIPEGGYMEITLSSQYPSDSRIFTAFNNQAEVHPTYQTFDTVGQGNAIVDGQNKKVGVLNMAPVVVTTNYKTSSVKEVEEIADPNNSASSALDSKTNTIVLPSSTSTFRYTLRVKNENSEPIQTFVLIDNLPEVGDRTPFQEGIKRGSEFKVSLAEEPNFKIVSYSDQHSGGELELTAGMDYEIEYRTDSSGIDGPHGADWHIVPDGDGLDHTNWSYENERDGNQIRDPEDPSKSQDIRAFRILISARYDLIPANATLEVSFDAKVSGEAEPGAIAWNSFGYHYHTRNSDHLEGMPLQVGVMIPVVPTLEKQIIDGNGNAATLQEDADFKFLIYEGERLVSEDVDALKLKLTEAGRAFRDITLTVPAGESSSGKIKLEDIKATATEAGWSWKPDQKYTIVEYPPEGTAYQLRGFNGIYNDFYTFTYTQGKQVNITCQNTTQTWSIKLIKRDGVDQELMAGAVFGLYSPNAADQLKSIPDAYTNMGVQLQIEELEQVWYLKDIQTTNANGTIDNENPWKNLTEAQYYLLEIKAPDGYNLQTPAGQLLDRDGAKEMVYTIEIDNYPGTALPKTGGSGTLPYTAGGLLMMAAAPVYLHWKRRREGCTS